MQLYLWRWWCAAAACWLTLLAAPGCMATRLLESQPEAALPLESPAHGYPTAIRASLSDDEAPEQTPTTNANHANAIEATQASTTTPPPDATSQHPAPIVQARRDSGLNRPPLAVIPPDAWPARPPAARPPAARPPAAR